MQAQACRTWCTGPRACAGRWKTNPSLPSMTMAKSALTPLGVRGPATRTCMVPRSLLCMISRPSRPLLQYFQVRDFVTPVFVCNPVLLCKMCIPFIVLGALQSSHWAWLVFCMRGQSGCDVAARVLLQLFESKSGSQQRVWDIQRVTTHW